jgi:hypothetical protein
VGGYPTQLALVAGNAGAALVPRLARDSAPEGVRILTTRPALSRTILANCRAGEETHGGVRAALDALRTASARVRGRRPAGPVTSHPRHRAGVNPSRPVHVDGPVSVRPQQRDLMLDAATAEIAVPAAASGDWQADLHTLVSVVRGAGPDPSSGCPRPRRLRSSLEYCCSRQLSFRHSAVPVKLTAVAGGTSSRLVRPGSVHRRRSARRR